MSFRGVTCPNCRTRFEARGHRPRCPACGARLPSEANGREEVQPLPPLPAAALRNAAPPPDESSLQGPDFLDNRPRDTTAPLSEFIAAFLMLVLLGLMVAGAALGEPILFQIGLFVLGAGAVLYAIGKIRAMARGVRRPSTGLDWGSFFFGGFARSGRRRIEEAEAEAEERKRRGWDNPDSFRR